MCREMGILESSNRLRKGLEAEKTVRAQPRDLHVNHALFGPPGQMQWEAAMPETEHHPAPYTHNPLKQEPTELPGNQRGPSQQHFLLGTGVEEWRLERPGFHLLISSSAQWEVFLSNYRSCWKLQGRQDLWPR